jgi:hypothetical protein
VAFHLQSHDLASKTLIYCFGRRNTAAISNFSIIGSRNSVVCYLHIDEKLGKQHFAVNPKFYVCWLDIASHVQCKELDDAKLAVVNEQKKVKAAQKETLVARRCETRLSNLLKDERRAWERERTQASDDIRKHAADLKKMQTDLQVSQKDAAPVESTVKSLEVHKVVADGVSSCLQTEIQQLRCESAAKTLENDETQNVVKELRS